MSTIARIGGAAARLLAAATLGPVLLVVALLAGLPAAPAQAAQADVYVQVNPNTIQAGFQVGIRASCGDDLNPAQVKSRAFGEITLTPQHGARLLVGSATVPADTRPDEYKVDLKCANGATASAELFVLGMARPTRGPATGGGGTAGAGPAGSTGTGAVLLAGGGLAALTAGTGLLLVRQRRTS